MKWLEGAEVTGRTLRLPLMQVTGNVVHVALGCGDGAGQVNSHRCHCFPKLHDLFRRLSCIDLSLIQDLATTLVCCTASELRGS
jgi:hypothetical protein